MEFLENVPASVAVMRERQDGKLWDVADRFAEHLHRVAAEEQVERMKGGRAPTEQKSKGG